MLVDNVLKYVEKKAPLYKREGPEKIDEVTIACEYEYEWICGHLAMSYRIQKR